MNANESHNQHMPSDLRFAATADARRYTIEYYKK